MQGLFGKVDGFFHSSSPRIELHDVDENKSYFFDEGESAAMKWCRENRRDPEDFLWIEHTRVLQ